MTVAADPKRLRARVGRISVLHTWGSALTHHSHIHMVVPLSADCCAIACWAMGWRPVAGRREMGCLQARVLPARAGPVAPVPVADSGGLVALHRAGEQAFFGDLEPLAQAGTFAEWLDPLRKVEWVVCGCPWFCKKYPKAWGRSFAVVCQASDMRLFSRRGPVWFVRGPGPSRLRGFLAAHPLLAFRSRLPPASISFTALLAEGRARTER
ncbi:transposase [Leisingera sp. M523]|uniref:transposase n=1 Tax=Leisingera sp. M523 TaxID=2867013 RepID=UPI0038FC3741